MISGNRGSIDDFILRRFEIAGRGRDGGPNMHYLNPGPGHVISGDDAAIVIYPGDSK